MKSETQPTKPSPKVRRVIGVGVSLVICIVVLGTGLLVYQYQINNPNKAPRQKPEKTARLVETITVEAGDYPAVLTAMGQVVPAFQIQLSPEIEGRIDRVSSKFVPGGLFKAGEQIMQVDPQDYELAVEERESEILQAQSQVIASQANLITAKRELAIEQGSQNIAKREFELLGEDIPESDRDLVLRVPQLQAAQAAVEAAQAEIKSAEAAFSAAQTRLRQAKLDVGRTSIVAPYNAVVVEKTADIGDIVNNATTLVTLQGTDQAWIELSVPLSQTRWINSDGRDSASGSSVSVSDVAAWGADAMRDARVIQVLPQLETDSRMVKVLAEVLDPLALTNPDAQGRALRVGSYVQARITGPTLSGVVRLPRSMVWDGDTVRVMNDQDELEIRKVQIVFRESDFVLIAEGLSSGDRVVTTNLSSAVPGLPLRVAESISADAAPDKQSGSATDPAKGRRP